MNYTQINNEILDTKLEQGGLDGFELLVYLYFLRRVDTQNPISVKRISEHYGLGNIEVLEAMKSLEARGMLKTEYYENDKTKKVYRFEAELKLMFDDFVDEAGPVFDDEHAPTNRNGN